MGGSNIMVCLGVVNVISDVIVKMAVELDPLFLKAIALLNSRHPDSQRQLSELIQDYRDKITGEQKREKPEKKDSISDRKSPNVTEKTTQPVDRSISPVFTLNFTSGTSVKSSDSLTRTSVSEFVETVEELSSSSFQNNLRDEELDAETVESFGEALIEELSSSSLLEPSSKKSKLDINKEDSNSSISEEDENDEVLLDESIEIDISGPTCCVCKSHNTDSADNCLVECHECHSYYHQRCHKPQLKDNVHDPRFVLYCSHCSRKMKKEMAAQQSNSNSATQEQTVTKPVANPFQLPKTSLQPFRRPSSAGNPESVKISTPSTSSSLSTSPQPPGTTNNGQSQSSPRSTAFLPQDMRMKSMKRLEQVKKRAKIQQQFRKR